jgi:hypothetical protein
MLGRRSPLPPLADGRQSPCSQRARCWRGHLCLLMMLLVATPLSADDFALNRQSGILFAILATYLFLGIMDFAGWLMAYVPSGWAIGALFLRMRLGLEWGRSINASLWMKLASSFLASAIGWLAISHSWLRDSGICLDLQALAVFMTSMPDQPSILACARAGVIWAAVAAFNSLVELLVLRVGWGR